MLTRFQLQIRAGKTACFSARIGTGLLKASSGSSRLTALRLSTWRPACGDVEATSSSYRLLDARNAPQDTSFRGPIHGPVDIVHRRTLRVQAPLAWPQQERVERSPVISNDARDLGFCLCHESVSTHKQKPGSLAALGMTTASLDGQPRATFPH